MEEEEKEEQEIKYFVFEINNVNFSSMYKNNSQLNSSSTHLCRWLQMMAVVFCRRVVRVSLMEGRITRRTVHHLRLAIHPAHRLWSVGARRTRMRWEHCNEKERGEEQLSIKFHYLLKLWFTRNKFSSPEMIMKCCPSSGSHFLRQLPLPPLARRCCCCYC